MNNYTKSLTLATALCGAMLLVPQAARADATPECNNGPASGSTECGTNATSGSSGNDTAVGANSRAGQGTDGGSNTALGAGSNARGGSATALGVESSAGNASVSIGSGAQTLAGGGIAIGASSRAVGSGIAIGFGSVALSSGIVSFGSGIPPSSPFGTPASRRLVNVSAGTGDTDAVNVAQMNAANALQDTRISSIEAANVTQDTRLTTLEALNAGSGTRIAALETLTNNYGARISNLELESRQSVGGIAAAMAMGGAVIVPDSNISFSLNLATYRGQQGFSGSIIGRVSDKVYITAGIAGSTVKKSTGGRVGITFGM